MYSQHVTLISREFQFFNNCSKLFEGTMLPISVLEVLLN